MALFVVLLTPFSPECVAFLDFELRTTFGSSFFLLVLQLQNVCTGRHYTYVIFKDIWRIVSGKYKTHSVYIANYVKL